MKENSEKVREGQKKRMNSRECERDFLVDFLLLIPKRVAITLIIKASCPFSRRLRHYQ